MEILFSSRIKAKLLEKHTVTTCEVEECFYNRTGQFLIDTREEHKTDPQTQWFISETDKGRKLKVAFVNDGDVHIKTAYEPSASALAIYSQLGEKRS